MNLQDCSKDVTCQWKTFTGQCKQIYPLSNIHTNILRANQHRTWLAILQESMLSTTKKHTYGRWLMPVSTSTKGTVKAIFAVFWKYEFLFHGTFGIWNTNPVDIMLKENATLYNAKHFPAPRECEKLFREEEKHQWKLGVLHWCNDSGWRMPCFIQPKKSNTV